MAHFVTNCCFQPSNDRKTTSRFGESLICIVVELLWNVCCTAWTDYRGIVDDSLFHESCQRVMEEYVPYFKQFTEGPRICVQTAPSPPSSSDSSTPCQQDDDNASEHTVLKQISSDQLLLLVCVYITNHLFNHFYELLNKVNHKILDPSNCNFEV